MNFESLKPARPGPITLLFSLWVSFVLPRQVVKPLINLREAVDHADLGTSKHVSSEPAQEFSALRFGEIDELWQGVDLLRIEVESGVDEISRVHSDPRFPTSVPRMVR
jgi:HAMP domain-containing protein